MSDQEWASGPVNGGTGGEPAGEGAWGREGEANGRGRSASPARGGGGRERSRSPMRGVERGRGGGESNPGNNLHVSGIGSGCSDEDLREHFTKYGTVVKCQVMKDPHTGDVRGFGFVNMSSADEAEAAIDAINGTEFLGKVLTVQKARRGRARTPTPGQYHGPPKDRGMPPRYDDRYSRGGGGGYGGYPSRYDDRDYYRRDDRDRYSSRYDDYPRGGGRYDDPPPRRYDDYYDRRPPPRDYDDRRRY